jgi:glutamate dehydrogenase (NAD(P)+)
VQGRSEVAALVHGPDEEDLVSSGLEDTMVNAYQEVRSVARRDDIDLRTAAMRTAIDKIAASYRDLGILP